MWQSRAYEGVQEGVMHGLIISYTGMLLAVQ